MSRTSAHAHVSVSWVAVVRCCRRPSVPALHHSQSPSTHRPRNQGFQTTREPGATRRGRRTATHTARGGAGRLTSLRAAAEPAAGTVAKTPLPLNDQSRLYRCRLPPSSDLRSAAVAGTATPGRLTPAAARRQRAFSRRSGCNQRSEPAYAPHIVFSAAGWRPLCDWEGRLPGGAAAGGSGRRAHRA